MILKTRGSTGVASLVTGTDEEEVAAAALVVVVLLVVIVFFFFVVAIVFPFLFISVPVAVAVVADLEEASDDDAEEECRVNQSIVSDTVIRCIP